MTMGFSLLLNSNPETFDILSSKEHFLVKAISKYELLVFDRMWYFQDNHVLFLEGIIIFASDLS